MRLRKSLSSGGFHFYFFWSASRSLLSSAMAISVACSTGVTILITGSRSLILKVEALRYWSLGTKTIRRCCLFFHACLAGSEGALPRAIQCPVQLGATRINVFPRLVYGPCLF